MEASTEVKPSNAPVFLQDFVDVARPDRTVSRRIAGAEWWLSHLATTAGTDTEAQLMRIGPAPFGDWIARDVNVRVGEASTTADSTLVPLRWEDVRHPHLFPVLDGNLEVAPLGPASCRVILSATYRPPLDHVGKLLDHAFLHRVAESTVRSFLTRLARVLEAEGAPLAEPPEDQPHRLHPLP